MATKRKVSMWFSCFFEGLNTFKFNAGRSQQESNQISRSNLKNFSQTPSKMIGWHKKRAKNHKQTQTGDFFNKCKPFYTSRSSQNSEYLKSSLPQKSLKNRHCGHQDISGKISFCGIQQLFHRAQHWR